ncbi:MAG: hypothetical protein ACK40A_14095, partial [Pannonibacter indicus]
MGTSFLAVEEEKGLSGGHTAGSVGRLVQADEGPLQRTGEKVIAGGEQGGLFRAGPGPDRQVHQPDEVFGGRVIIGKEDRCQFGQAAGAGEFLPQAVQPTVAAQEEVQEAGGGLFGRAPRIPAGLFHHRRRDACFQGAAGQGLAPQGRLGGVHQAALRMAWWPGCGDCGIGMGIPAGQASM